LMDRFYEELMKMMKDDPRAHYLEEFRKLPQIGSLFARGHDQDDALIKLKRNPCPLIWFWHLYPPTNCLTIVESLLPLGDEPRNTGRC